MSSRSFQEAFEKIIKPTFENNVIIVHQVSVAEIGATLAKRTPIDRGYAKANWNAGIEDSATQSYKERDTSQTGARAKRKILSQVAMLKYKPIQSIYLKNAVVGYPRTDGKYKSSEGNGYIIQLEQGKSDQAPTGILGPIMPIIPDLVKRAIRSAK